MDGGASVPSPAAAGEGEGGGLGRSIVSRTYTNPRYAFRPIAAAERDRHHPVVIVGAGVVGLTLALDLARRGIAVVVLDEDDTVAFGSRAICWSQRSLQIYDRLGIGDSLVARGITWNLGKVFHRDRAVYAFDLLPEQDSERPAFINLQQYYVEQALVEAVQREPQAELRWRNRVTALESRGEGVTLGVETPEGSYALSCDWLVACDGARSPLRAMLGLPFEGQVFHDRFLIADVLMEADFPAERWFWFDPPFHPGQSVLLHKQADRVWRIDFQLGLDADPEEEAKPERVEPRLRAMLGPERPFSLEWVSVYSFKCRRLERFRHGRVLFAGDAAHQVSPFGARGGNSGIQDADNLGWKLAAVLRGEAPAALLDSYDAERGPAADENILHTSRATEFITPKTPAAQAVRDAVLELAEHCGFARALVNSGRLSRPHRCLASPLSTPDEEDWRGAGVPPGCCAVDAPLGEGWLLRRLGGNFVLLTLDPAAVALPGLQLLRPADSEGRIAERYGAGSTYLIRPDQVVAARWQRFDSAAVAAALRRALGHEPPSSSSSSPDLARRSSGLDARVKPVKPGHDGTGEACMGATLLTDNRLADPDALYSRLVEAHRDLDEAASRRLDVKLVLLLANHIGDERVFAAALELAKGTQAP